MAVGDLYKLTPQFNMGEGGINQNVHFYETTAEIFSGASLQDIGEAFNARMTPRYRTALCTGDVYAGVHVQEWNKAADTPLSVDVFVPAIPPSDGLDASDQMPNQVSGIISWRTAFPGRRFRGRTYIPAGGELSNGGLGRPTPGYLGVLGLIAEELSTLFTVLGADGETQLDLVIYSRTARSVAGVVDHIERDVWGTQRRRRIGVGI